MNLPLIVVLGPTASGKTRLAAQLAYTLDAEIISADSRQVYRGMDIGTGKDYSEYIVKGKTIPTHLIDIMDAGSAYDIASYVKDFEKAFEHVQQQHKPAILCGGSGMYIDAVLKNYTYVNIPVDLDLREQLQLRTREELIAHFNNLPVSGFNEVAEITSTKRLIRAIEINTYLNQHPEFTPSVSKARKAHIIGLTEMNKEKRNLRIWDRLAYRLEHGLIEEIERLLQHIPEKQLIRYGLEYKFVTMYLRGAMDYTEMNERLFIAIRQFAKRQMTYFRKMEREGRPIHWIDASLLPEEQLKMALHILKSN